MYLFTHISRTLFIISAHVPFPGVGWDHSVLQAGNFPPGLGAIQLFPQGPFLLKAPCSPQCPNSLKRHVLGQKKTPAQKDRTLRPG